MTKPSKIKAEWRVELNTTCPSCGAYVNLIDHPDYWDGNNLDLTETETECSDNYEAICPECEHEFTVCCVW